MRTALVWLLALAGGVEGQVFQRMDGQFPGSMRAIAGLADLDGDGDVDGLSNLGQIVLNDGSGRFRTHPVSSTAGYWSRQSTRFVDLDGDGDLDIVRDSYAPGAFENDGTGVFTPAPWAFPAGTWGVRGITFGDLDMDGDADAFVVRSVSGCSYNYTSPCSSPAEIWLNDGAGNLTAAPGLLPPGCTVTSRFAAILDWDSDGLNDIFVAQSAGAVPDIPRLVFSRSTATGTFTATTAGPATAIPNALLTGDFDGDLRTDLLVTSGPVYDPQVEEVYLNAGTGLFGVSTFSRANRQIRLTTIDLDGDGDDEFVRVDGGVEALDLSPTGQFSIPLFSDPVGAWMFPVPGADIDGDGDEDLVGSENDGTVHALINDGIGALVHEPVGFTNRPYTRLHGDVDGDGDIDFLLNVATLYQPVAPLLGDNDGRGGISVSPLPVPSNVEIMCRLFDMDLDGDLDLFMPGWTTDAVMRNDGAAGFVVVATWPALNWVDSVRSGDLNGDGVPDLVLARHMSWTLASQWPNYVAFGTGGGFSTPVQYDPVAGTTLDLDLVDIDADGDLDILEANYQSPYWGQGSRILLNSGGTFTPSSVNLGREPTIRAGDLDGDGDLDIVGGTNVWLNDGTGSFTGPASLPITSYGESLALVDVDLDGDLDIIINGVLPGQSATSTLLLENDGAANFTFLEPISSSTGSTWGTIVGPRYPVGDVDGDGDPDLLIGDVNWFSNTTRQLHAPGLPRIGQPLSLQVFDDAAGSFEIWASLSLGGPLTFPEGVVHLDPSGALQAFVGTVANAAAPAEVDLLVPFDPGLVGLTVHWQALLPTQGVVTNAISTTVAR